MAENMKPVLAYEVSDDEGAEIVFARHAVSARRIGANELNTEFDSVSCRRAQWADEFADIGWVPASTCVAHGWQFDGCSGCGAPISEGDQEDRGLSAERVHGGLGGTVFCCIECAAEYEWRAEDKARLGAEIIARLKDRIRSRFGDVKFIDGRRNETAYVTDDMLAQSVAVSFDFPGQTFGGAMVRWDSADFEARNYVYAGLRRGPAFGPAALELTVCHGDREAFETWRKTAPSPIGRGEGA